MYRYIPQYGILDEFFKDGLVLCHILSTIKKIVRVFADQKKIVSNGWSTEYVNGPSLKCSTVNWRAKRREKNEINMRLLFVLDSQRREPATVARRSNKLTHRKEEEKRAR